MSANKKRKVSKDSQQPHPKVSSPISQDLFTAESVARLRTQHGTSGPYLHSSITGICDPARMRLIHEEIKNNMTTTFKESDLFKVFQTCDLGVLDSESDKIPQLVSLRQGLYSAEFRGLVSQITGCGELTDRIDLSINAYTQGCHLLCHDDVISTRRISYIIYITDPDDEWMEEDGGVLELFPIEQSTAVDMGPDIGIQGVPTAAPTSGIVPKFNTMAFFVVQPGRSYHAVQEVFADKPRVSISGWYHATEPPKGSDMASLGQIMKRGEDTRPFTSIPLSPTSAISGSSKTSKGQKGKKGKKGHRENVATLSPEDHALLSEWINPEYLKASVMAEINEAFCSESSMQLQSFLRADRAAHILDAMKAKDEIEGLGNGRRPIGYELGVDNRWKLEGPAHLRRFLKYSHDASTGSDAINSTLHAVEELFQSPAFARYLQIVTSLLPLDYRTEIRRFRPGLDYTVAHYGTMTQRPRLDATLCFVNDEIEKSDGEDDEEGQNSKAESTSDDGDESGENDDDDDDDDEDEEEETSGSAWASGDCGGFECYIEADDESPDASEVYMTANKQEKDTSLLSVSAAFNVLNVVMRDEKVMRFVKYVSAQAPGSRWDVTVEYNYEQ